LTTKHLRGAMNARKTGCGMIRPPGGISQDRALYARTPIHA
jgi:hypothetical protein